jgi:hypothetical protein
MEKELWVIILVLIIVGLGIFFIYSHASTDSNNKIKDSEELQNNSNNISENSSSTGLNGIVGGSGSSVGNNINETENLPEDLYERACGFYVQEYSVCAGSCPSGECVSEGKSCYCKNIN